MRLPQFAIHAGLLLASLAAAGAFTDDVSPTQRLVWAHTLPSFPLDLKLYRQYKPQGYGGLYPLGVRESFNNEQWQSGDVRDAKAAGINGFAVDVFTDANAIRGYLGAADSEGGFLIAPCLDLSMVKNREDKPQAAIKTIEAYGDLARGHPSAAKVNGKFVVFTYGTSALTADEWDGVRKAIREDGVQTYWVADVVGDGSLGKGTLSADQLDLNLRPFEAGYVFGNAAAHWSGLIGVFKNVRKPFDGGMMPGYDRAGGGFIDPRGTELYRFQWKKHLTGGADWTMINTWNDLTETSAVMPTSDWSTTRSEITKWFAAKYRGETSPFHSPHLYITSPKTLYLDGSGTVEALVLNGSDHSVKVRVELFDGDGNSLSKSDEQTVEAGEDGAATIEANFSKFPAKRFARAHVSVSDDSGVIEKAVGAPIIVADKNEVPGIRLSYYSLPASSTLAAAEVSTKVSPGRAKVSAGRDHRFMELLRNNVQVGNYADEGEHNEDLNKGDEKHAGPAWGFYVSRMVDKNGKIAYSDPVYVAPTADVSEVADYVLDGSGGDTVKDKSPFARVGKAHGVSFGNVNGRACGQFDGTASYVSLTPAQTPAEDTMIKLTVHSESGGVVFADTGGMIIRVNADGHPAVQRKSGAGWCVVESPKAISGWSEIGVSYKNGTLSLLINGNEVASKPCDPGFKSNQAAIGCNPFGKRSAYFNGDIAEFIITRL